MEQINVTINPDVEQKKTSDVPALCKKAEIKVTDQKSYDLASGILKDVKSRYKELENQRKDITGPLDRAKKAVMDLFRDPLELLQAAENKLKRMMIDYTSEQERLAEEERKRLQAIADKEAERQKKLLEKKIERAEASGKTEKVEELIQQKEEVKPIVAEVTPKVEKPSGVSFREKWSAEVIDANLVPREYLMVNQQLLDKVAGATKGSLSIPGVKFVSEKVLASRV